jgi:uncharacterized damage-inducible protein DinB
MQLIRHFQIMARANRLMNHRLHKALSQLSLEDFHAPRVNFFPSLWQTANHILIVDWYYLDALEDGKLGRAAFADETPFATMADIYREQKRSDERLIAFCDRLKEGDLARTVNFDRGTAGILQDRIDLVLPHVFMHQTHHRGQLHAMLAGTAIAPPQLDEFLMATDARFRQDDLAELGWTEADLTP